MTLEVVSANYGGYDVPLPPVAQDGIKVDRWVMVTDNPILDAPGWELVIERRPHVLGNVAAKVPKFRPDLYCPDAEVTLWIDGNALIKPTLVAAALEACPGPLGMFPHPNRTRITDEVAASRGLRKYDSLDLEGQVDHYLARGYPDGYSLWATGCILRRYEVPDHRRRHRRFGDQWLREVVRWGFQDQLSFAYLSWLWAERLQPTPLGVDLWNTPHLWWGAHAR